MRSARLLRAVVDLDVTDVIDCAVGRGYHSQAFLSKGMNVTGIDIGPSYLDHSNYRHIQKSFEHVRLDPVDLVWSCHTLEHVQNVGLMLTKFREWLKPDGWLAISVPSDNTHLMIDGHMTFWTPAHLIYNLVVNGWDCSEARFYTEGRDIALMVKRKLRPITNLNYDRGDLETLAPYFPVPIIARETDPWLEDKF